MSGVSSLEKSKNFFAIANITPFVGIAPLRAKFSPIIVGGTPPYTITWDFGDGSDKTNEFAPIHIFKSVGTYKITLTITDSENIKTSYTQYVRVMDSDWAYMVGARFTRIFTGYSDNVLTGATHLYGEGFNYSTNFLKGISYLKNDDNLNHTEMVNINNT